MVRTGVVYRTIFRSISVKEVKEVMMPKGAKKEAVAGFDGELGARLIVDAILRSQEASKSGRSLAQEISSNQERIRELEG